MINRIVPKRNFTLFKKYLPQWVQNKILNYADYLEHGDPEDIKNLPEQVYENTPHKALEVKQNYIPADKESDLVAKQDQQLQLTSIEQDRLSYLDSVLGTRTYLPEPTDLEERTSYDAIMERRWQKCKAGKQFEFTYGDTLVKSNDFYEKRSKLRQLSENKEQDSPLAKFKSPKIRHKFTSLCGTNGYDEFGYYDTNENTQYATEDFKMIYLMQRSSEYDKLSHKINNMERTIQRVKDEKDTISEKNSWYFPPIFYEKYCYFFVNGELKVFRRALSSVDKELFDQDFDKRLKQLKESDEIKELNDLTSEIFKPEEFVTSAEELRTYFFNFKDQYSFFLCRLLKNEEISFDKIEKIIMDEQNEEYVCIVLKFNEQRLAVIKSIAQQKYYKFYLKGVESDFNIVFHRPFGQENPRTFVIYTEQVYSNQNPQMNSINEDDPMRNNKVMMFELESEDFIDFVDCLKDEDLEINSVVKYMKDNELDLINNDEFKTQVQNEELFCINDENFFCDVVRVQDGVVIKKMPYKSVNSTSNLSIYENYLLKMSFLGGPWELGESAITERLKRPYNYSLELLHKSNNNFMLHTLDHGYLINEKITPTSYAQDVKHVLKYKPYKQDDDIMGSKLYGGLTMMTLKQKSKDFTFDLQQVLEKLNSSKNYDEILDLHTSRSYISLIVRNREILRDVVYNINQKNGNLQEVSVMKDCPASLRFFMNKNYLSNYVNIMIKSLNNPMSIIRLNNTTNNFQQVHENVLYGQKSKQLVHEEVYFGDQLKHVHLVYNESTVFENSPVLLLLNDSMEEQYNLEKYSVLLRRGFILCYYNQTVNFNTDICKISDDLLAAVRYMKSKNIGDSSNYFIYSEGRYSGIIAFYLNRNEDFVYTIVKNPICDLINYFEVKYKALERKMKQETGNSESENFIHENDNNLGFGDIKDKENYDYIRHLNSYNSSNQKNLRNILIINDKQHSIDGVQKFMASLKHYCKYWKSINLMEINEDEIFDSDLQFTSTLIQEAFLKHRNLGSARHFDINDLDTDINDKNFTFQNNDKV